MKFLDLFAGIGGFRLGLERAGHECIGFCEIDRFARDSYKAIHNTEGELELHDITGVSDDDFRLLRGKVDIIAGGFPCQSFSIAGKREGFADKTKGTLFFEIARAAKQIQPQLLFLENVKGLLNHDKGNTFRTIISTLDELGYDAEWQLLNSKDFGVPQNRERVFIIGHLRGSGGREVFPIEGSYGSINQNDINQLNDNQKIKETIGFESINRFYNIEGISPTLNTMSGGGREPKIMVVGNTSKTGYRSSDVYDENGISSTLMARDYKGPKQVLIREATKRGYAIAEPGDSINFEHPNSKTRRGRVGKGLANTLTTSCNQGVMIGASRGRNPDNPSDRRTGSPTEQRLEINQDGVSNALTTVQKDNYVVESVLEIAKRIRPNIEIEVTVQDNGDIRPHRMDKKKSGLSELNINHEDNQSHTVTTSHMPKVYGSSTRFRIRKLTPLETWRLQGFPDEAFRAAEQVNSNSQLYKQAGNSVTVNVIETIAKRFKED